MKKILFVILFTSTLHAQTAKELQTQAEQLFLNADSEKEYKEAAALFEKAVATDSTDALAMAGLAKSYAMLGRIASINFRDDKKIENYKKAAKMAGRANKANKGDGAVWTAMAYVYRQLGQRDNLLGAAGRAIAKNSNDAEAYDLWADAYSSDFFPAQTNTDSSILIRQKSVEVQPNFAKGYRGLGDDFMQKGDFKQAEAMYNKAIELNPKHAGSHDRLGQLYYRLGDFDRAKIEFSTAHTLDPRLSLALSHLGDVLFDEGKFKEAFLKYTDAIDLNANAAYAFGGLSWMYLSAKDKEFRNFDHALEYAATAVGLTNYKNAWHLYVLAEAYYGANKPDLAIEMLEKAIALDVDNPEYQESLLRYKNKEKNREYIFALKRGENFLKHQKIAEAVKELSDAYGANSEYVPILLAQARAFKMSGDAASMTVKLNAASKLDKNGKYKNQIEAIR